MKRFAFAIVVALFVLACAKTAVSPANLDTRNDACASCRMAVSNVRFAAQLAAPAEEPRFFDDIGCLRDYLAEAKEPMGKWTAFVADHRTKSWVRADQAVYTRVERVQTPMDSHLIAHENSASRDADAAAKEGAAVTATEIFGKDGPPAGKG
jgi:copper chaperone NosL